MPISEQAPKRIIRCRYIRANDERCTGEVLDPEADVQLCLKHTARVVEHARATYERFRLEAEL
ncbi:hypothetical protein [Actinomadura sp. WMMA1423]|uniref:hypothetical protein n=1 Tax=Actinomadura sp. WMMA1423 TaxID=2591108 RepID=UPI0011470CD3|nr:hypothetical protein [Actinomadura sp. WMMA1423]